MEALRLFRNGELSQTEIAGRLHAGRQSVSRWISDYKRGGERALRKSGCQYLTSMKQGSCFSVLASHCVQVAPTCWGITFTVYVS